MGTGVCGGHVYRSCREFRDMKSGSSTNVTALYHAFSFFESVAPVFFFYNNISLCCHQSHRSAVLKSCGYEKLTQIYKDISGFIRNHMAEDQELPQVWRAQVIILSPKVLFYRADWLLLFIELFWVINDFKFRIKS